MFSIREGIAVGTLHRTGSATTPLGEGDNGSALEASLLYAAGDLHQIASLAPPAKAALIHVIADFLAGLAPAKD